jgi:pimeloyl-ACP methyl ester carboxylesterase
MQTTNCVVTHPYRKMQAMNIVRCTTTTLLLSLAVSGAVNAQTRTAAAKSIAPRATTAVAGKPVTVRYKYVDVDGHKVFYREAGNPAAPNVLLLHGFPTSSHMYRNLIPLLADRYHVIAPDLLGFGNSDAPDRTKFKYTFDNLAKVVENFTQIVGLKTYAVQVFDYGAPIGLRLAMAHPERVTAIISQNGNAYDEGLGSDWNPIQKYWKEPTQENREPLRVFLKPDALKNYQYLNGAPDPSLVSPDGYLVDSAFLARPGNEEIQLDLFLDYASNVALYPKFQEYFRKHQPPLLAVWGKNDPLFIPPGAAAFKRDLPKAEVRMYDAGHFALEAKLDEIAPEIRRFLDRTIGSKE